MSQVPDHVLRRVRLLANKEVDPELDEKIQSLLCQCFPSWRERRGRTRYGNSLPSQVVVLEDDGLLVGHLALVDRTIEVGSRPVRVAGVQGVCVSPRVRGQGYCLSLLEIARRHSKARGFQAMMLFCGHALEPVYARCGYASIDGAVKQVASGVVRRTMGIRRVFGRRVIAETPGSGEIRLLEHGTLMWQPVNGFRLPSGPIHLRGPDW